LPGRSGTKKTSGSLWDGIVGVTGRYAFADDRKWFVPFYRDVGTGQTKLTWQAGAGVGYGFRWGDVVATWRHMEWNAKSGKSIEAMNLSGPMIGATGRACRCRCCTTLPELAASFPNDNEISKCVTC
jgi:hypothetical protein